MVSSERESDANSGSLRSASFQKFRFERVNGNGNEACE